MEHKIIVLIQIPCFGLSISSTNDIMEKSYKNLKKTFPKDYVLLITPHHIEKEQKVLMEVFNTEKTDLKKEDIEKIEKVIKNYTNYKISIDNVKKFNL